MVSFNKISFVLLIIISSSSILCAESSLKTCHLSIKNSSGDSVYINTEIADTNETRARGLMFREELPWGKGMIFVFESSSIRSFWMKNTFIPLDIAYIDEDGIINEIYTMKPLDSSIKYTSIKPARYALEVNAGWFEKNNITVGSKVELYGCFGK